jgi:hypothetical protein
LSASGEVRVALLSHRGAARAAAVVTVLLLVGSGCSGRSSGGGAPADSQGDELRLSDAALPDAVAEARQQDVAAPDAAVPDTAGPDVSISDLASGDADAVDAAADQEDGHKADSADVAPKPKEMPFLVEPGPINEDMKEVWALGFKDAEDEEEAKALFDARKAAMAALAAHPDEVREKLAEGLGFLDPSNVHGLAALVPLLNEFGDDPKVIGKLSEISMGEPGGQPGAREVPDDEVFRRIAVDVLGNLARKGSAGARDALIGAAGAPDPYTALGAVSTVYRVTPDRRMAQRKMRAAMSPDRHWMLYR